MANQKVKEIQLGDKVYDVCDNEALHEYETAGYTHAYYVNAVNGDDSNDGLTAGTAWKSMKRVVKHLNSGKDAVNLYYLMGTSTYTLPSDVRSIAGCTPHFMTYNGSATLKFDPHVGSAGPCFYNVHVNISGTEQYPMNIESAYGGIYFEGVALSLGYCNVKCNLRVYGGSAHVYNCVFTNKNYHQYATNYYPQITFNYCNASVDHCVFNTDTSHPVCGVYCGVGSVVRFYGENTFKGNGLCIHVDSCTFYGSGDLILTNWTGAEFMNGGLSSIQVTENGVWDDTDKYHVTSSTIMFGRNIGNNLGCIPGESISLGSYCASGFITSGGDSLVFTIPLPRTLTGNATIKAADISTASINVRYAGHLTQGTTLASLGTVTVSHQNAYYVTVNIALSTPLTDYGHQPASVYLTGLQVLASRQ